MNSTADKEVISSRFAIYRQETICSKSFEAKSATYLFIGYGGQNMAHSVIKPRVPSEPMNIYLRS
jgi:hypothetical protein